MIPEWPCPYCGHDYWNFAYAPGKKDASSPVVCGHCNVLFTAHWVDGCWMGRMVEADWPGSLPDFVAMRAETLREERP